MTIYKHCDCCIHQRTSLEKGVTCGLTKRKPEFTTTCDKIHFSYRFKRKLQKLDAEYHRMKKSKTAIYQHFVVYLCISLALILLGIKFWNDISSDFGYHAWWNEFSLSSFFILFGYVFLSKAFAVVNTHYQELRKINDKREALNNIITLYQTPSS